LGLEEQLKEKIERKETERAEIICEIESIESSLPNRGAKAVSGTAQFGCLGVLGWGLMFLGIGLTGLAILITIILGNESFGGLVVVGVLIIILALFIMMGAAGGGIRAQGAVVAARETKECKTRLLKVEQEINQIKTLLDP